jgi:hypothetical protein
MYPTDSPRDDLPIGLKNIQRDIEELTSPIEDPQYKPYLRQVLIQSLVNLGHSSDKARAAVDSFYKVALQ